LFFHYYRHRKDFLVNFLLFFFTGFAIVVYLNQAGNQPRERDYAYVGSFYAFAVWIGLAFPALGRFGKRKNNLVAAENIDRRRYYIYRSRRSSGYSKQGRF
jgi:hypothetical protein